MRLSFHYEPEFHIDLRPVASMTAIGAIRPLIIVRQMSAPP